MKKRTYKKILDHTATTLGVYMADQANALELLESAHITSGAKYGQSTTALAKDLIAALERVEELHQIINAIPFKPSSTFDRGEQTPMKTPLAVANVATEMAYAELIKCAARDGMVLNPVMGFVYLPDPKVIREFQLACRKVLVLLGCTGLTQDDLC